MAARIRTTLASIVAIAWGFGHPARAQAPSTTPAVDQPGGPGQGGSGHGGHGGNGHGGQGHGNHSHGGFGGYGWWGWPTSLGGGLYLYTYNNDGVWINHENTSPFVVSPYAYARPTMGPIDTTLLPGRSFYKPQPVTPQPDAPDTRSLLVQARDAMKADKPADAKRLALQHAKDVPDDADLLRFIALADLAVRDPDEAFAMMKGAYAHDLELADRPMVPADYGLTDSRFRELLGTASAHANKLKSVAGWFTLAVMLQADNKKNAAWSALQKAKAAGLDLQTFDRFAAILKPVKKPDPGKLPVKPPVTAPSPTPPAAPAPVAPEVK